MTSSGHITVCVHFDHFIKTAFATLLFFPFILNKHFVRGYFESTYLFSHKTLSNIWFNISNLFNKLLCIVYHLTEFSHIWAVETFFKLAGWFLCLWTYPYYSLIISLCSSPWKCSRINLYFPMPDTRSIISPRIHGARRAHCYWGVTTPRAFQWTGLENSCISITQT